MHRGTIALSLISCLATACATISETYYVAAYDPASSGGPNYYRIEIRGNAGWTKLKYSTGYYSREAVERLFGEIGIQRDYESFESGSLEPLDQLLGEAEFVGTEKRVQLLRDANAEAQAQIAAHRTLLLRRDLKPDIANALRAEIERLAGLQSEASGILDDDSVTDAQAAKAKGFIREIEVGLVAVQDVVDDGVVVRFFDGAGIPIDTVNKVQVIFAATDSSQITSAFSDFVQVQDDTTRTVALLQADQTAAGNAARSRASESLARIRDIHSDLDAILAGDATTAEALEKRALAAAAALADGPSSFETVDELDAYLEGLGR